MKDPFLPKKKIPQGITLPSSLLRDVRQEPLKKIVDPYRGITHVPAELAHGDEATLVFIELNKCFQRAGYVAEGWMANIIWGFAQCGYNEHAVASGLKKLRALGYVQYTDPQGLPLHELSFNPDLPIWIRYEPKMLDLFVRKEEREAPSAHSTILSP